MGRLSVSRVSSTATALVTPASAPLVLPIQATTATSASPPAVSPSESTSGSTSPDNDNRCLWNGCGRTMQSQEHLYDHLCEEHIGRKVQNNLKLVCEWEGCQMPPHSKRDHITSHVRVHVNSKPHVCSQCGKSFKRPQDLKKHTKTHVARALNTGASATDDASHVHGSGHTMFTGQALSPGVQTANAAYYENLLQSGANCDHAAGYYGSQAYPCSPGYIYPGPVSPSAAGYKRSYAMLDDLFGAVKRRELDPTSYSEVSDGLVTLHGMELPVHSAANTLQPVQAIPHSASQPAPMLQHPQAPTLGLPRFANLKTRKDLLNASHFLKQSHATTCGAAALHMAYPTGGLARTASHSTTHSGTPALTPSSELSQRSLSSSMAMNTLPAHVTSAPLPLPSMAAAAAVAAANLYPTLATTTSSVGVGLPPAYAALEGLSCASAVHGAFGDDRRLRYVDGMRQKAARPEDAVGRASDRTRHGTASRSASGSSSLPPLTPPSLSEASGSSEPENEDEVVVAARSLESLKAGDNERLARSPFTSGGDDFYDGDDNRGTPLPLQGDGKRPLPLSRASDVDENLRIIEELCSYIDERLRNDDYDGDSSDSDGQEEDENIGLADDDNGSSMHKLLGGTAAPVAAATAYDCVTTPAADYPSLSDMMMRLTVGQLQGEGEGMVAAAAAQQQQQGGDVVDDDALLLFEQPLDKSSGSQGERLLYPIIPVEL